MKYLEKKKWIIIFAVCAVIAAAARPTDMLLAKAVYNKDSLVGSFFFNIAPAVPFALSSFACAVMMSCRSTRTTRSKNRVLTVLYAVLSLLFAGAAAMYPFIGIDEKNYTVIAIAAFLIAGCSIFIAYTAFNEIYQKIVMTRLAKIVIFSTLGITAVCLLAALIPQRGSYEAIQICIEKYGRTDGPFESTVPFISFVGASAPVFLPFVLLSDVLPKLKFSARWLFIASCIWTLAVTVGSVVSGRMFLSEAVYGALIGYSVVLAVNFFVEKREKI